MEVRRALHAAISVSYAFQKRKQTRISHDNLYSLNFPRGSISKHQKDLNLSGCC